MEPWYVNSPGPPTYRIELVGILVAGGVAAHCNSTGTPTCRLLYSSHRAVLVLPGPAVAPLVEDDPPNEVSSLLEVNALRVVARERLASPHVFRVLLAPASVIRVLLAPAKAIVLQVLAMCLMHDDMLEVLHALPLVIASRVDGVDRTLPLHLGPLGGRCVGDMVILLVDASLSAPASWHSITLVVMVRPDLAACS